MWYKSYLVTIDYPELFDECVRLYSGSSNRNITVQSIATQLQSYKARSPKLHLSQLGASYY